VERHTDLINQVEVHNGEDSSDADIAPIRQGMVNGRFSGIILKSRIRICVMFANDFILPPPPKKTPNSGSCIHTEHCFGLSHS
jgi:hypothetical protein